MDAKKKSSLSTRGGRITALVATLAVLFTVGLGTAFANEGGISGVLKDVTEFITSGFGAKGSGVNDIPIQISWIDDSNTAGVRPESVWVYTVAEDGQRSTHITGSGDVWTGSIAIGGDESSGNGFWVIPETLEEYTSSSPSYGVKYEGETVDITYTIRDKVVDRSSLMDLPISVQYSGDNDDELGNRQNPVKVTVTNSYNGAKVVAPIEIGADGTGSGVVPNLPVSFTNGDPISYSVSSQYVAGYSKTQNANSVDGTPTPSTVSVSYSANATQAKNVVVKWMDSDATQRPSSIVVSLEASGAPYSNVNLDASDANVDGNTWTWTGVMNMDKFLNKKSAAYTASTSVAGYSMLHSYASPYSGATITLVSDDYTPSETVDVPVSIVWEDDGNSLNNRPSEVAVNVYAYIDENQGAEPVRTITVRSDQDWQGAIDGLPKYDADGNALKYRVVEAVPEFYRVGNSYVECPTTAQAAFKNYPIMWTVDVRKQWDDDNNAEGARPASITVGLYRDSTKIDEITLSGVNSTSAAGDTWGRSFLTEYPMAEDGAEIVYTVEEDEVANYTAEPMEVSLVGVKGYHKALGIRNTYNPTINVVVQKVWNDNDNENRPDTVNVNVYANGDTSTPVSTAMLSQYDSDPWTHTFTLPAVDGNGDAISYSVAEVSPEPGYTPVVTGDMTNGYTITNNYSATGTAKLRIQKTLSGREWTNTDSFEFTLTGLGGAPEPTTGVVYATSENHSPVIEIPFTSAGTFSYRLAETHAGETIEGVEYDPAPKTITITMRDLGDGRLRFYEYSISSGTPSTGMSNDSGRMGSGTVWSDTLNVPFTNTYTVPAPVLGNLTVSKTVVGDGAPAQVFQFAVTLGDDSISGDYGGMSFTNGTATFGLSDGQSVTATGLPAGTNYQVTETTVANFSDSWSGQSGTIPANATATASCTNTYMASAPEPEVATLTVDRSDFTAGIESAEMRMVEDVPDDTPVGLLNTSRYVMSIRSPLRTVPPVADPTENTLTYDFTLSDGETMSVDLIVGSDVSIENTTTEVDLEKIQGDGTSSGQTFTVGTSSASSPLTLTVGARGAGSGNQGSGSGTQSGTGEGSITINQLNNAGAKYNAYKVFDADVRYDTTDAEDKTTHVQWATGMQTPVMAFINAWDTNPLTPTSDYQDWLVANYGDTDGASIPQNVAEYIGYAIEHSDTAAGTPAVDLASDPQTWRTTEGLSFADGLAQAVASSGVSPKQATTGVRFTDTQGYWLFVTDTSTIGDDEAGTAPIWTTLSDRHKNVNEKTSIPTLDKVVKENTGERAGEWGPIADSHMGKPTDFKVTSTVGQNILAYPSYSLNVVDTIPEGMTIDTSTIKVKVVDGDDHELEIQGNLANEVTDEGPGYVIYDDANRTLTVNTDMLYDFGNSVSVGTGSRLVVEYKAALNEDATYGVEGNVGTATLTYTADPITGATASTLPKSTKVVVYKVKVDKVDAATRQSLDGAEYRVKTLAGDYLAADGSIITGGGQGATFTTANGYFTVPGLDEGTYLIEEVGAPQDYEGNTTPLTLIISATKNYTTGELTGLNATVSGGNTDHMATTGTTAASHEDGLVAISSGLDEVEVRTSDDKVLRMPLTGMKASDAAKVYGATAAIVSLYAWHTNRKRSGKGKEYDYEWIVAR